MVGRTRTNRCLLRLAASVCIVIPACHQPAPPSVAERIEPATHPTGITNDATASGVSVVPEPIAFPIPPQELDRWLIVEEAKDRAAGAWATGSFDVPRNKIAIVTHNVRQFAMDTDRIAIDWDRLVILGIDGRNSELRKRDHPVLHIALDEHGQWVVREP